MAGAHKCTAPLSVVRRIWVSSTNAKENEMRKALLLCCVAASLLAVPAASQTGKTQLSAVIRPGTSRGNALTLVAVPGVNNCFVSWTQGTSTGTVLATTTSYTFTPTAAITLVANFEPAFVVTVQANPTTGGTVSGGGTYCAGSSVTVTATPN